jgi:pimeloyl-ACP methyl ester carboxylesterase
VPGRSSALACTALLLLAGCIFRTVAEQQRLIDSACRIIGHVSTVGDSEHPIIVGLVVKPGEADAVLIDHFVIEGEGDFGFATHAGTYGLGAFESLDDDLTYDAGEPGLGVNAEQPIRCAEGQTVSGIELRIPRDGHLRVEGSFDLASMQGRSASDQEQETLGRLLVRGQVTGLDDPRFDRAHASSGLWRPLDFIVSTGAGVYFLQPYDPEKIPVLFVHGMVGTPRDFDALIGNLDRARFQPWVFYYPTGASLDSVVRALSQVAVSLRVQYHFPRLFVVAHSMGGLVSRGFLLQQEAAIRRGEIPLFVSLATPWLGQPSAASGVAHAPTVVRSWYAMAPNSAFQRALFFRDPDTMKKRRPLPEGVVHHLFFGFHRDESWPGESGDSTIALVSQLRAEAQADAVRLYGHDDTHTGILEDPLVSAQLNAILAAAR